jgi:tetratricopeptide (TPR) repeat protein
MDILSEKNKLRSVFVMLFFVFLVGAVCLFYFYYNGSFFKTDYLIQGVPYAGIFNHKGKIASFGLRDSQAAVYSIMEYWNPGKNNPEEINSFMGKLIGRKNEDILDFFEKKHSGEYSVKIVNFSKIADFKSYINPNSKTPLLIALPVDSQQPANIYNPIKILIGISEHRKILTFHDFWLGNNYEMTFGDFDKLANKSGKKFIAIQPANLKEKLKELASRQVLQYPARTKTMTSCENAFKNYAIARNAGNNKINDVAKQYADKAKNDPCFEQSFPKVFKMGTYINLANMAVAAKDPAALAFVNEAISLDNELDKPSGDWPGFDVAGNGGGIVGQSGEPYWMAGNVYAQAGDFEKAKENFEKALSINPDYAQAKKGLDAANAILSAREKGESAKETK